ncbi:MAG: type VI secretion system protein TssA [Gemmatimonadetes bacterium]|nr:type VI secretion system protein TssA [Gemmatimonadota bacterium]MCC6770829.1 type VI secretion system protein TssA [Gemmatimonadaceae bacterium]
MPVDTALIEALLTPVPGDNPAGTELRYDPRYEAVKEARREDPDLPRGEHDGPRKLADWPVVLRVGRELVEKESKDLQLTGWLTEGLLNQHGLPGLASGLTALHGILDKFWEGCFPEWDEEDPELRAGPLEWVGSTLDIPIKLLPVAPNGPSFLTYQVSRTVPTEAEAEGNKDKQQAREIALKENKPTPEDVDKVIGGANKSFYKALLADLAVATAALAALEKEADKRFGRDAPSLMKVRSALDDFKRLGQSILTQKLIDDPDPIVEEVVDETGAPVDDGTVLSVEPVSAADATNRVSIAARFLRKLDPTNPGPYLMLRGLRWGELRASAATGDLEPKLLEATPTAVRSRLKGLLLDGKWSDLLEQCEAVMGTPQGRGWIDLQRYALTACAQLGYGAVAAAIRDQLRVLLAAIPQLPEMTLMDDSPTANPETQAWLAEEQLVGAASDPAPASVPASGEDQATRDDGVMHDALVQEDSTSKHGGLAAGPRRRVGRDPFEMAKSEMAQGRVRNGIELLLAEAGREQSPRGRFLRQTQLAYIMVESGMDAVARPILERLVATIDERNLEEWESGPLVAQPLALLCRIMDRSDEGGGSDRYQLYLRVCKLDTLQAMQLQSS